MSKKSVAPARQPAKRDSQAVPLGAVAISLDREPIFAGEEGRQRVTLEGQELAKLLRWAVNTCPSNPAGHVDASCIAFELIGMAETCRGLASADLHAIPVDCHAIFSSLGDRLRDLAHRIEADQYEGTRPVEITISEKNGAA